MIIKKNDKDNNTRETGNLKKSIKKRGWRGEKRGCEVNNEEGGQRPRGNNNMVEGTKNSNINTRSNREEKETMRRTKTNGQK